MRVKTIISLIAFVTAFAISVVLVPTRVANLGLNFADYNNRRQNASKITSFLEQDIANGLVRDRTIYEVMEQEGSDNSPVYNINRLAAVSLYTERAAELNYDNLSPEFAEAWKNHLDAWQNYSEFLSQNIDSNGKILCERKFAYQDDYFNSEISRTWYEVLAVTGRQGAEIPANAF